MRVANVLRRPSRLITQRPLRAPAAGGAPGEGPEQAVEAGEAEESVAEEEPAAEPEEEPAGDEG